MSSSPRNERVAFITHYPQVFLCDSERFPSPQHGENIHIACCTFSSVKTCELLDMLNRTLLTGIECFQSDEHLKNLAALPHQWGTILKSTRRNNRWFISSITPFLTLLRRGRVSAGSLHKRQDFYIYYGMALSRLERWGGKPREIGELECIGVMSWDKVLFAFWT